MNPIVYVAALGAVATVASAYFVYRLGKRTNSGGIDTSTAGALWDEGTKMRLELRSELVTTREQLAAVRERLDAAIAAIATLTAEVTMLRAITASMHEEVKTSNALTIGALADNSETRRILLVPAADRTPVEQEHLATAHNRLPDAKRADQKDGHE